jgi:hypothetical protein
VNRHTQSSEYLKKMVHGVAVAGDRVTLVSEMTVRTFARPEDVDAQTAYKSHPWTLYATDTELKGVSVDRLKGRCHVALSDDIEAGVLQGGSVVCIALAS